MAQTREIEKLQRRWQENPLGLTFAPLAEAYRKEGMFGDALELLAIGLSQHPNYIPAHIVMGRCYLDTHEHDQAEAAFSKVLELDPENAIALKSLADLAERAGRYGEALVRLDRLLEFDRNNEEARAQRDRVRSHLAMPAPGTIEIPSAHIELVSANEDDDEPRAGILDPDRRPVDVREYRPLELTPAAEYQVRNDSELLAPERAVGEGQTMGLGIDSLDLVRSGVRSEEPPPPSVVEPISLAVVGSDEIPVVESPPADVAVPDTPPELVDPIGGGLTQPETVAGAAEPIDAQEQAPSDAEWRPPEPPPVESQAIEPESVEPESIEPQLVAPQMIESESIAPQRIEPESIEPSPIEQESVEPEPGEPRPVESERAESERTESESADWQLVEPARVEAEAPNEPVEVEPVEVEPIQLHDDAQLEVGLPEQAPFSEPAQLSEQTQPSEEARPTSALERYDAMERDRELEEAELIGAGVSSTSPAEPEPVDDGATDSDSELVVTETMAEVFLRQGHRELALAVYTQLLGRDPLNERIRAAADRLETELRPAGSGSALPAYAAVLTGGHSVRSYFESLFGVSRPGGRSTTAAALSLGSVFGEERAQEAAPDTAEAGESFDQFFGAQEETPELPPRQQPAERTADPVEDIEEFNSWLRGLKR